MVNDKFTVVVRPSRHGSDKPFELCIQVHTADEETQLVHEDYLATMEELVKLRAEIERAISIV